MNIAILTCNKLSYECCGAWCLQAFSEKSKGFAIYKDLDEEIKLYGFFHCNGCDKDLKKELDYKMVQLKKCNVTRIHLSLCVKNQCNRYDEIKSMLENEGFEVVYGTH